MRPYAFPTLLSIALALAVGCGGGAPAEAPAAPAAETPAAAEPDRYTVRGEITAVETGDDGVTRLFVHHEAIPDFRVGDAIVGMDSMTMGFEVGPGVPTEGLEVGGKIEFEWVIPQDSPAGSIAAIEVLAPDTELALGGGHASHGS